MTDNRFQAAHEISKVYHALSDRESLQAFFLQSLSSLLPPHGYALYLAGVEDKIWLETSDGLDAEFLKKLQSISDGVQLTGKPFLHKTLMSVPLISGNTCFGTLCIQTTNHKNLSEDDCALTRSLGMEFASAFKGIQLLEDNLRMARLAAIGQTSSMVVHELKNILQLARLSEEMLQMGLRDNNPKFIAMGNKKIQHALKEMDGFIWEMLSLARDQKLEPKPFHLSELFAELEEDLQTKTKASSAILKWEVPKDFPEIQADRKALFRALLNLVKNAYEARRGDAITVTLRAQKVDDEFYTIVVTDDGAGMSEQTRARLFQAFYTTKGESGTGLGLMIVGNTVRLHRGTIQVQSEVGKGTSFILKLPFLPVVDLINQLRKDSAPV